MPTYQKKPDRVTATQWNQDGDHERVKPYVKFFWSNMAAPYSTCKCGRLMRDHGLLDIGKEGYIEVCPGQMIVHSVGYYPMSVKAFHERFERVQE